MRLNRSNIEDFIIYGIYCSLTFPWIGIYCLWTACLGGVLGMIGGSWKKSVRRFGCPIILYCSIGVSTHTPVIGWQGAIIGLLGGLSAILLSIGYGLPSTQPPDEGSALGRFYWNLTTSNQMLSNIATRLTIYTALLIPWVIVKVLYGSP